MADPATMALLSSLPGLFGGGQLGAAAPAFQPGMSGFRPRGLLSNEAEEATRIIQQGPNVPAMSIEDLIGRPETRGQPLAAQARAEDVGPPEDRAGEEPPSLGDRVGGFFGNLDQTLQSPSKVIGMGLLNRIDPRLGAVGLLAGGLLGQRKVF